MYTLIDGTPVTVLQILDAFENGQAVLVHGRGNWCITTALQINGQHHDTRGECYSSYEESWTDMPESLRECLDAASVRRI